MLESHLQSVRYKLQRRLRTLQRAESEDFDFAIRRFFSAIESIEVLKALADLLLARHEALTNDETINSYLKDAWGKELQIPTEEEHAAVSSAILRKMASAQEPNFPSSTAAAIAGSFENFVNPFIARFVEPIYEFMDEALDDERSVLSHLIRYKQRSEWFERGRLLKLSEDTDGHHREKVLKDDLHGYLHDQGLDVFREVHSASGIADFASASTSDYQLIAEAKFFKGEKRQIIDGFNQAYIYACEHSRTAGYLVIFDTTEDGIRFLLSSQDGDFPYLVCNNKTIFLLTIDIADHARTASKRGQYAPIEISEQELIASTNREPPAVAA